MKTFVLKVDFQLEDMDGNVVAEPETISIPFPIEHPEALEDDEFAPVANIIAHSWIADELKLRGEEGDERYADDKPSPFVVIRRMARNEIVEGDNDPNKWTELDVLSERTMSQIWRRQYMRARWDKKWDELKKRLRPAM